MMRFVPIALVAAALVLAYALGLHKLLSLEQLRLHHQTLIAFVAAHPVTAPLGYAAVYVLAVALSLPGAAVLTVAGGFLFGAWLGTGLTVIAATTGATLIFLAARTAFGDLLRARAGPALRRMEEGFRRDAFSYLLMLRLIPLFPFFLVNLVPAFLGVRLRTYVAATLLGVIPATLVFTLAGCALDRIVEGDGDASLDSLLPPEMMAALFGLALLALAPVLYRRFAARAP
jgi:uncharacterized membrane protein YdjX (TVP38/TMEM64 family)